MLVWIVRILWIVSVCSMIVLLWIVFWGNSTGMNMIAWEYFWDEQFFFHIVPGVQLHPNLQVQPKCMNRLQIFLVYPWGPHNIIEIWQSHGTDPHDWIMLCMSIWQTQTFEHGIHNKLGKKVITKLKLSISSPLLIAMVMHFPSFIPNGTTTKFGHEIKERCS